MFWNNRGEADRTAALFAEGGVSRDVADNLRSKGLVVVNLTPSDALLRAMIFRVDPSLFGPLQPHESQESRKHKYDLALYTAKCMYEEIVGLGLYQAERDQQFNSFLDRLSGGPPVPNPSLTTTPLPDYLPTNPPPSGGIVFKANNNGWG
jgi:hypothetical protein